MLPAGLRRAASFTLRSACPTCQRMEQKRHLRNYRMLVIGLDGRVDLHFLHLQTLLRLLKVPPLHLMMTSHVSATPTTKPSCSHLKIVLRLVDIRNGSVMNMFRFMQSLECTVLVPLRITEVVIRLVCRLPNQVSKRSSSTGFFLPCSLYAPFSPPPLDPSQHASNSSPRPSPRV